MSAINPDSISPIRPTPGPAGPSGPVDRSSSPLEELSLRFKDTPSSSREPKLVVEMKNDALIDTIKSPHLFANINLGAQALHSGFEGLAMNHATGWALNLIDAMRVNQDQSLSLSDNETLEVITPFIRALHQECINLRRLVDQHPAKEVQEPLIQKAASEWKEKVLALAPEVPLLLPVGWAGKPGQSEGHAMYLQFEKRVDGTYNMLLFNTTHVGLQGTIETEEKVKTVPLIAYEGITREELFFSDNPMEAQDELFIKMLEPWLLPLWNLNDPLKIQDLNGVLKNFQRFSHRRVEGSRFINHFMTAQRSGTCSQKSLNALLLYLFNDPKKYKALSFDSRFYSIINFFHAKKDHLDASTVEAGQNRFQLRLAIANLSRAVEKYHAYPSQTYPSMSREKAEEVFQALKYILDEVDKAEKTASATHPDILKPFTFTVHEETAKRIDETSDTISEKALLYKDPSMGDPVRSTLIGKPSEEIAPDNLLSALNSISSRLSVFSKSGQYRHMAFEIESLIDKISLPRTFPDPYWSRIPSAERERIINSLVKLLSDYFLSTSISERPLTASQYNYALSLLAMIHQMALLIDKSMKRPVLDAYGLSIETFENLLRTDLFYLIKEPHEMEKREKLIAYFSDSQGWKTKIFDFASLGSTSSLEAEQQLKFYQSVADKYPEIAQPVMGRLDSTTLGKFKKEGLPEELIGYVPFLLDMGIHPPIAADQIAKAKDLDAFSPLLSMGLHHLVALKQAALAFSYFMGVGTKLSTYHQPPAITILNESFRTKFSNYYGLPGSGSTGKPSVAAYASSTVETFMKANLNNYLAHTKKSLTGIADQNPHLLSSVQTHYRNIVGAVCEPRLLVSSLFTELMNNPSFIDTDDDRALVKLLLFKPMARAGNDAEFAPLFDDLRQQEGITIDRIRAYMAEMLKTNLHLVAGEKPRVEQTFFLIELACMVNQAYFELHGRPISPPLIAESDFLVLQRHLDRTSPLDTENLSRLYSLKIHDSFFNGRKERTIQEWETLISQWIFIQSRRGAERQRLIDPALKQTIDGKMTELEPQLSRFILESGRRNPLCSELLRKIGLIDDEAVLDWMIVPAEGQDPSLPSLTVQAKALNGLYTINLSTGKISDQNGLIMLGEVAKKGSYYARLFGDRTHHIKMQGATAYFADPHHGQVRIADSDYERGIQKLIKGEWCQYVPVETLKEERLPFHVPHALFGDYTHWIAKRDGGGHSKLYLTDIKTGKLAYVIDRTGTHPVLPGESVSNLSIEYLALTEYASGEKYDEAQFLSGFEEREYALVRSSGEERTSLTFPRYSDEKGEQLTFFKSGGRWVYSQDPHYHLEKPETYSTLGNTLSYLTLVNTKTGKRKLIVPLVRFGARGFHDEAIRLRDKPEIEYTPQNTTRKYCEFREVGDTLLSDTPEGNVLLANIFLAQKDYFTALTYLNRVTKSEVMSPALRKQLDYLLGSGCANSDYSADACAVRLQAWLILKMLDPFGTDLNKLTYEAAQDKNTIENVYRGYLNGLNTVAEPLLLSRESELRLLDAIDETNFKRRLVFLETGSYPEPIEKQLSAAPEVKKSTSGALRSYLIRLDRQDLEKNDDTREAILKALQPNSQFQRDYAIMLSGNKAQKEALAHKLSLVDEVRNIYENTGLVSGDFATLLEFVYHYPDRAPSLPKPDADDEQKIGWVAGLVKAMQSTINDLKIERKWSEPFRVVSPGIKERTIKREKEVLRQKTPMASRPPSPLPTYTPPKGGGWDGILKELAKGYLAPQQTGEPAQPASPVTLSIDPKELGEEERDYAALINAGLDKCAAEIAIGSKRLLEEKARPRVGEGSERDLQKTLQAYRKRANQMKEGAEAIITHFLNLPSEDPFMNLQDSIERVGRRKERPTIAQAIRASLAKDDSAYLKLCPRLEDDEIMQLHQAVLDLMTVKSAIDQMDRVLEPLAKWTALDNEQQKFRKTLEGIEKSLPENPALAADINAIMERLATIDREKGNFIRLASVALSEERRYDLSKDISALYFEYVTGFRISKDQAQTLASVSEAILTRGADEEIGVVFQLIMGGGKTSVILSRLMELAAEKGLLPFFVTHHSQYAAARGTLKKLQGERYGKNVIPFEYTSKDLRNVAMLEHIYHTLEDSMKAEGVGKVSKDVIILASSTLQLFQLEMIMQIMGLNQRSRGVEPETMNKMIEWLQKINSFILENGIQMMDEIDLTLQILQMVNMPTGEKAGIKQERILLVRTLYETLAREPLGSIVKLQNNSQKNLTKDTYNKQVAPVLATTLASSMPQLFMAGRPELINGFVRFATGAISSEFEEALLSGTLSDTSLTETEKSDAAFLRFLHVDLQQGGEERLEAANLISLAAHLIQDVVPSTLSKEGNRAYGRAPDGTGRIVPYLGVNSPASTEFGYIYELICYHFQTALSFDVEPGPLRSYAEQMTDLANHYVATGEKFNETAEAVEFLEFTGVSLSEIDKPGNLEKALDKINSSMESKILFEEMLATFLAKYYASYLSSTPISLVDQTKKVVGCSGTIHNADTFNRKISTVIPDVGSEGKILAEFLQRSKRKEPIPLTETDDLPTFLKTLLGTIPSGRAHALLEGGGLLKKFTSMEVANGILDYYAQMSETPTIKGVVFLHRFSHPDKPGETYESFALLTQENSEPIPLTNTSAEELTKHGLELSELFVYYDELRNTGTDIPLPIDTIAPGTVDPTKPVRNLSQMLLRLRQFFGDQDVDVFISTESRELFVGNGKTADNIIQTAVKASELESAKHIPRSFESQVDNFYRTQLVRLIMESSVETCKWIVEQFEPFLLSKFEDNPYLQHGRVKKAKSGLERLQDKAVSARELFTACHRKNPKLLGEDRFNEMLQSAIGNTAELLEEAKEQTALGLIGKYSPANAPLGLQVEFNIRVETEMEQQKELELSQELQNEIERYRVKLPLGTQPFEEVPWEVGKLSKMDEKFFTPRIIDVSTWLRNGWGDDNYPVDYGACFPPTLKATQNFTQTCNIALPIFHSAQKPAEHLLIRELPGGRLEGILLSQKDAQFFKNLTTLPGKSWLITTDKLLASSNGAALPDPANNTFHDQLDTLLGYVHLLNGDAAALNKNPFISHYILEEGNIEEKQRFLKIRVAGDQRQSRILANSSLFSSDELKGQATSALCRLRREQEFNVRRTIGTMSPEDIARLSPKFVHLVPPEKVQYLTTSMQLGNITIKQIDYVTPVQINLLRTRHIRYLKKPEQITQLSKPMLIGAIPPNQLYLCTDEQLTYLSSYQIANITDPSLIQRLPVDLIDHLPTESLNHLTDRQWLATRIESAVKLLPPRLVDHIDPSFVNILTPKQVSALRNPSFLPKLDRSQIPYVDPSMVHYLSDEQLYFLTQAEQIRAIPEARLGKMSIKGLLQVDPNIPIDLYRQFISQVSPSSVPYLNDEQLYFLSDAEQIRMIPKERLRKMTKQDFLAASFNQTNKYIHIFIKKLPEELINDLSADFIEYLNEAQIKLLTNPALVACLSDNQLKYVSPDSVQYLDDKELYLLRDPKQIARIPPDKLQSLTAAKYKHLHRESDIFYREEWKYNLRQFANKIPIELINEASPELAPFFTPEQVRMLSRPESILRLEGEKLAHISPERITGLDSDQIRTIASQEFRDKPPEAKTAYLMEILLDRLTPEQIGAINDNTNSMIHRLSIEKLTLLNNAALNYLSAEQVKQIRDPLLLKRIPAGVLVNHVHPDSLQHLTDQQIKRLTDPALFAYIPPERYPHISGELLFKMPLADISRITHPVLLKNFDNVYRPKDTSRPLIADMKLFNIDQLALKPNMLAKLTRDLRNIRYLNKEAIEVLCSDRPLPKSLRKIRDRIQTDRWMEKYFQDVRSIIHAFASTAEGLSKEQRNIWQLVDEQGNPVEMWDGGKSSEITLEQLNASQERLSFNIENFVILSRYLEDVIDNLEGNDVVFDSLTFNGLNLLPDFLTRMKVNKLRLENCDLTQIKYREEFYSIIPQSLENLTFWECDTGQTTFPTPFPPNAMHSFDYNEFKKRVGDLESLTYVAKRGSREETKFPQIIEQLPGLRSLHIGRLSKTDIYEQLHLGLNLKSLCIEELELNEHMQNLAGLPSSFWPKNALEHLEVRNCSRVDGKGYTFSGDTLRFVDFTGTAILDSRFTSGTYDEAGFRKIYGFPDVCQVKFSQPDPYPGSEREKEDIAHAEKVRQAKEREKEKITESLAHTRELEAAWDRGEWEPEPLPFADIKFDTMTGPAETRPAAPQPAEVTVEHVAKTVPIQTQAAEKVVETLPPLPLAEEPEPPASPLEEEASVSEEKTARQRELDLELENACADPLVPTDTIKELIKEHAHAEPKELLEAIGHIEEIGSASEKVKKLTELISALDPIKAQQTAVNRIGTETARLLGRFIPGAAAMTTGWGKVSAAAEIALADARKEIAVARELIKIIESGGKFNKWLYPPSAISNAIYLCRSENRFETLASLLLRTIADQTKTMSRTVTGIFLDKAWLYTEVEKEEFVGSFYGNYPSTTGAMLSESMRRVVQDRSVRGIPDHIREQLPSMLGAMSICAGWSKIAHMDKSTSSNTISLSVIDQIQKAQVGVPVLIPVNTKEHFMLIEVLKGADGTYRLKYYNTGFGIEHHANLPGTHRIQSFIQIDRVPESSLMDIAAWKDILTFRNTTREDVDHIYGIYFNRLGKGGIVAPASKNPLDYTLRQEQGTCASMPWVRWLRDRFVQSNPNDFDEGYVAFRLFKTSIFKDLLQRGHQSGIDEGVDRFARKKLEKHLPLFELYRIAGDETLFNKNKEELLLAIGRGAEADRLMALPTETPASRFRFLQEAHRSLANIMVAFGPSMLETEKPDLTAPHFAQTRLVIEDREFFGKRAEKFMEDAYRKNRWEALGKILSGYVSDPRTSARGMQLAESYFTLSGLDYDKQKEAIEQLSNEFNWRVGYYGRYDLLLALAQRLDQKGDGKAMAAAIVDYVIREGWKQTYEYLCSLPDFDQLNLAPWLLKAIKPNWLNLEKLRMLGFAIARLGNDQRVESLLDDLRNVLNRADSYSGMEVRKFDQDLKKNAHL